MHTVLLFNPRATTYARIIPNSILQIAASIEGKMNYIIVDGNRETDPWTTISRYMRHDPVKYFCVTVMPGPQLTQAIPFTKEIKERFPNTVTVWGGYFASNHSATVMNAGYVDYVIDGPGDYSLASLLDALETGKPLAEIPGLVYREGGRVKKNHKGEIPNQDTLPSLPYSKLNEFYSISGYLGRTFLGKRTISYHSSMGCPFTCSFCGVVPIFNARWKAKSAEKVFADIVLLKNRFGGDSVQFHDNNFFVSEKRAANFARLIVEERMNWWAEGRIDTMDNYSDDTLRLLAKSGCRMIFFGAETGNDALLKAVDKGGTQSAEGIKAFARRIRKFGIIPEYSFILGFPAPTAEEVWHNIQKDISFIKEIKKINPNTEIIIYVYSPVPTADSQLFELSKEQGFFYPKTLDQWLDRRWLNFDLHRNPMTPWLKPAMVRQIHNFETVLQAHFPTVSDYKLTRVQRLVMNHLSGWRFRYNCFRHPYELQVLMRFWLKYRRPEKEGF